MSRNDTTFRKCCTFFLAIILVAVLSTMAFSLVSQTPLFLTTSDKPNIAILLDNSGSMWNMMYHPNYPTNYSRNAPFTDSADYQLLYGNDWRQPTYQKYYLHELNSSNDFIGDGSRNFTYNSKTIQLPRSSDSNDQETRYNGAYLNWLFYAASAQDIAEVTTNTSFQKTRMRAAKDAIKAMIANSYNSSTNSYPYRWRV